MVIENSLVLLFDVDNTLLDNDRFASDLGARLEQLLGSDARERYFVLFAALREQLGYADYLTALQQLRAELADNMTVLQLSMFLLEYPFAERLYPQALAAVEHLSTLGQTVVLSDGDAIFQPRKIQHAGIWDAFAARVLIYMHKERKLDVMQRAYPADHYVMIDDKPNLLAAMKRIMHNQLTTVFVRQGHYARDADMATIEPAPDLTINSIKDLLGLPAAAFRLT